ncbi:ribosomal protein S5 domain 2-type protein [Phyllosticta citricarpa]|uniref:Ribosomal protein S5 domain 2-type protein n=1 Tax=Phyllosticta citricarpa TaxID=55181 RepID=A0ABR1MRF2_9PEZI
MNPALDDEIISINSIYAEDTLTPTSDSLDASTGACCILRLPSLPSVALRLEFPPDYPDAPPAVLGTHTVGDDVAKGFGTRVVDAARDVLAQTYRPGEPCVFDVLEELGEKIVQRERDAGEAASGAHEQATDNGSHVGGGAAAHQQVEQLGSGPAPPWVLSEPAAEKKSVFVARAAPVSSPHQAKAFVQHLLATDKKAAKATHNITAWRIRGANDAVYQDCDDDGETAAGGRVLHLMQLMDVWDVMVVVTRWYGGVHLGPDRFRIINQTAREALVLGGFVREEKEKGGGKKKGKK